MVLRRPPTHGKAIVRPIYCKAWQMMITDYLQVADTRYARVLVPEPLPWDIWRIRNDFESPAWDYACRTLHINWMNPEMKQAPQVVPFYLTPNATSGGNRTPVETWKP